MAALRNRIAIEWPGSVRAWWGGGVVGMRAMKNFADDDVFLAHVTERLATLSGVQAVTLGGSRAQGTHTAESD